MLHRGLPALFAGILFLLALPGYASERITSFHSEIEIAEDGSMVVEETISVVARGKQIKRGIYRDFPTSYKDRYGNRHMVDFKVLAVTRDGQAEDWHVQKRVNGVRIYAGNASVYLDAGQYTYSFRYRTDWQLGFFELQDELYWNVTGNGWAFFMDRASARVTLPKVVAAEHLSIEAFTGRQGSRARNYTSEVAAGEGAVATTAKLRPAEGLTIVFSWPKGVVREPGTVRRFLHLLSNNLGLVLSLLAFSGSAAYLGSMWHRYGRDPEAGVIFPHYEPPAGYSPASLRYVRKMGYDKETFSAAVINLAVKGHVTIDCSSDDYTLRRNSSKTALAAGEETLLNRLFRSGTVLELQNENHALVSAARKGHKDALASDYRNLYFKTNTKLMLPSLLVSALLLAVILVTGSFVPLVAGFFVAVALIHILFAWLLRAPSMRGRRLMDRSEGFKLYLEVAEKDDLNLRNPPELTPQLFETYLPYAVALGVEQEWAEQFTAILAKFRDPQSGASYQPNWYQGNFNATRMGSFSKAVGSGLSSAISSAATAPGSSSGGGGGGFSGGGGGGGGGGGW